MKSKSGAITFLFVVGVIALSYWGAFSWSSSNVREEAVACNLRISDIGASSIFREREETYYLNPGGENIKIKSGLRADYTDRMMGLQRYFHVPEEAQNTGLFRYSIEMATKSCPHGPGALTVYLRPAQAESGVITGWSPLRSESSGGMFVLRTQHHNGDYIEIPVEDELLALVLRNQLGSLYAEDIPAQSLSVEQVIGDASIKRVAARFRWSSLVTKGQILEMFDGILRAKWELDGSQKYAAIVLGSPTFQSADLVTSSSVFWPQVRVTGMNEVTDPVEVVTGVLYWR